MTPLRAGQEDGPRNKGKKGPDVEILGVRRSLFLASKFLVVIFSVGPRGPGLGIRCFKPGADLKHIVCRKQTRFPFQP